VAVTYPAMPIYDRMFAILREEAKRCGFELRLDGLEATVAYKKEMQKQHEMPSAAGLIGPPVPDFHQFLHSTNAFDDKGNPKPQTNNLFVWAARIPTALSEKVRNGRSIEEAARGRMETPEYHPRRGDLRAGLLGGLRPHRLMALGALAGL
jgi:microcin C transport system substrate-binding protein